MRRTRGLGTAGRKRTIAESTRLTSPVILRAGLLAPLELEHQPPQEGVQLALLGRAQSGGDHRFLRRLRGDRLLPRFPARVRQLDEDSSAVVRLTLGCWLIAA